jgi:CO/xanthine dehydrogenase FAD-binding subunit
MGRYERPPRLADALELLDARTYTLLAGGTDFYPARVGRAISEDILDLAAIADLRGIAEEPAYWRLGALTTWSDLIAARLPPLFDGYKLAAREVGGVQIQNGGTLVGNLCNASPAADGTPNLLALDAIVELQSARGLRRVAASQFVLGNRRTQCDNDEIVTAILVPKPRFPARSHFLKLGARRYLVISIAMVAAVIEEARDGTIHSARIAVGSCSAVPQRLPSLESALAGKPRSTCASLVRLEHLAGLSPITDVRATAEYRREAALELVRRTLAGLARC